MVKFADEEYNGMSGLSTGTIAALLSHRRWITDNLSSAMGGNSMTPFQDFFKNIFATIPQPSVSIQVADGYRPDQSGARLATPLLQLPHSARLSQLADPAILAQAQ